MRDPRPRRAASPVRTGGRTALPGAWLFAFSDAPSAIWSRALACRHRGGNHEGNQVEGKHIGLSTTFAWLLVSALYFRKADHRGIPQQGRRREDCDDQPAHGGRYAKDRISRPLGRPETVAYPVDLPRALLLNPCKRQRA